MTSAIRYASIRPWPSTQLAAQEIAGALDGFFLCKCAGPVSRFPRRPPDGPPRTVRRTAQRSDATRSKRFGLHHARDGFRPVSEFDGKTMEAMFTEAGGGGDDDGLELEADAAPEWRGRSATGRRLRRRRIGGPRSTCGPLRPARPWLSGLPPEISAPMDCSMRQRRRLVGTAASSAAPCEGHGFEAGVLR